MAISTFHVATSPIDLDEFLDYVEASIDVRAADSMVEAAHMLERLAQNKKLLIDVYNTELKDFHDRKAGAAYSPSSAILGKGRKKNFIVRANLWPPLSDTPGKSIEQEMFSYNLAHDHNFDFLTANYFGPGYSTDIWEYDGPGDISGYEGEPVNVRFVERTTLHSGKQLLYRRCKDIHIQYPPTDFSASINLMAPTDEDIITDQFVFDLERRLLKGHPAGCPASRRVHMLDIAGALGNEDTVEVLLDIARTHPCQRSRAAALEGVLHIAPDCAALVGEAFESDRSHFVRKILDARNQIKAHVSG